MRKAPTKVMFLIIIKFSKFKNVNKIIDEGLVWYGELY